MKTYRVCILDFSKKQNGYYGKLISEKFVKGIKEARKNIPVKMHYSYNARAFIGYDNLFEYWIIEI